MFFSKPNSYLGIDIGAGGVKVVELKKEKNRPVLFTYGFTSTQQDIHRLLPSKEKNIGELRGKDAPAAIDENLGEPQVKKYADLLKQVCALAKTVSKNAVVSIPVSAVFHAVVNLPPVDKKDVDHILKAEVAKLLPRPLEEMSLDYQALPPDPATKNLKFVINAVPRELVIFYTKVFQKAGLVLAALEPESTALSRSLMGRDAGVSLIIDLGAERTNFFIIENGAPMTHHSIEVGGNKIDRLLSDAWGVDESLVGQLKYDLFAKLIYGSQNDSESKKILEILMPVIDPIVKEIEYSFDVYFRQTGNETKRPEKIILTGGAAFMPFLTQHLAETFKIKCYLGDPWGRVVYQEGLKPVLGKIGPRLAVAIGLAMRNIVG